MKLLKLPNRDFVVAEHILGVSVSAAIVKINRSNDIGGTASTFTAESNESALNIQAQLNEVLSGANPKQTIYDPSVFVRFGIDTISPGSVVHNAGATITINGNLINQGTIDLGELEVLINGVVCAVTSATTTQIILTLPNGTGTGLALVQITSTQNVWSQDNTLLTIT